MHTLVNKIRSLRVDRREILIESLLFVGLYILLQVALPRGTPARIFIETMAVLTSTLSAAVLIFISLPVLYPATRTAWFLLALALLVWGMGDLARLGYLFGASFLYYTPDLLNLLAYLLAAFGLMRYPSESRYLPTSFRLVLDAAISSGTIATIGWLILVRPVLGTPDIRLMGVIIAAYPIADVILLTLLLSISLSSLMPRITALFLGFGLAAFTISDYAYISTALFSFEPAGLVGLGWLVGPLLVWIGAIYEKSEQGKPVVSVRQTDTGLSAQFQRVFPVALVLVLFWYVFTGWRIRGDPSTIGLWMSVVLGLMLIVRLGIRAGEAELNNYWQLFKNLGEPAFVCEADGEIVLSNPAFHQLDRSGEEQMTIFSVFPDLPEAVLGSISTYKSARAHQVSVSLPEGSIPYQLSLHPVVNESGRVLIAGVAYNLSDQIRQRDAIQSAYDELQAVHLQLEELNTGLERKVAERTANLMDAYRRLEEQNKILQELDQLKSDFVSMVSHELRNPLNNLGGGLELLLARPKRSDSDQSTLALMQVEVHRLTRFVESILDVSALEAGRLELQLASVSLPPVLEQLARYTSKAEDAERIQLALQPDLPEVLAAQTALESVLRHLVDNAIKYAPEGPVVVSAAQENGQVCIRVRDFGPGIAKDKRKLLFGRFQRLDARDSQSVYGYGLGLYLSRRLLEEMGSTLTFDAPQDGGARFSFSLQVANP